LGLGLLGAFAAGSAARWADWKVGAEMKKSQCKHPVAELFPRAYFKHLEAEFLIVYCGKCDTAFLIHGYDIRDDKDE
jgi:hypothetical protein